jgi:chaperonin GroEL
MYKQTLFGKEAREKVLDGINKITDVVSVTLGAKGRNVIISKGEVIDYGTYVFPNHVTKDGVTCAKAFDVTDPFEKVGVMAVKEAAEKSVSQSGDGTTTTCVLLRAIAKEGMRLIDEGANPMELKRGIDEAVKYVIQELKKISVSVKGDVEKIRQVATVSANNDSSIGDMIAEAFAKIGEEGIIDIEPSATGKSEIKIAEGIKISKGWLSPVL